MREICEPTPMAVNLTTGSNNNLRAGELERSQQPNTEWLISR